MQCGVVSQSGCMYVRSSFLRFVLCLWDPSLVRLVFQSFRFPTWKMVAQPFFVNLMISVECRPSQHQTVFWAPPSCKAIGNIVQIMCMESSVAVSTMVPVGGSKPWMPFIGSSSAFILYASSCLTIARWVIFAFYEFIWALYVGFVEFYIHRVRGVMSFVLCEFSWFGCCAVSRRVVESTLVLLSSFASSVDHCFLILLNWSAGCMFYQTSLS